MPSPSFTPSAARSRRITQPISRPHQAMAPDRIERSPPDSIRARLEHGVGAVYDFLLGDDLENTFGADRTLRERALGAASLAINFVPIGIGIGVGAHATKLAALESARLAAIAKGEHTIAEVNGRILAHPSQDLLKIESLSQTIGEPHSEFFHIGKDDAFIEARLQEPLKFSDGSLIVDKQTGNPKYLEMASSFTDGKTAQESVNKAFADPVHQNDIQNWLADGAKRPLVLSENIGRTVGSGIRRIDLIAGNPKRIELSDVRVVLKKDTQFPEGYKILTSYPEMKL